MKGGQSMCNKIEPSKICSLTASSEPSYPKEKSHLVQWGGTHRLEEKVPTLVSMGR